MPAPSKFKPEFVTQVRALCRLGATDREIAEFFHVDRATLSRWKLEHEAFVEALREGKAEADNRVEQALYQRAIGYTDDDGKHWPSDVVACIFWLKNRRPDLWRDKRDVDVSGKVDHYVAEVPALAEDSATWLRQVNSNRGELNGSSSGDPPQFPKLDS